MHMTQCLGTYSYCGDPVFSLVSSESMMSLEELQHDFRRHEKHSVLIDNLMATIPELSLAVQSSLYAELSRFGQPLTSPIMHQLYCIFKRSMFEMDLFSIADFVDGHINSDGHLKEGSSHIYKNYNRKLTVLSSNMLQGFLWRYICITFCLFFWQFKMTPIFVFYLSPVYWGHIILRIRFFTTSIAKLLLL